jgi:DNA-directed RNA polymerase subunit RPC12/RpoP
MIETVCKKCENKKSFNEDKLGKKFKCPNCGEVVLIEQNFKKVDSTNIDKYASPDLLLQGSKSSYKSNKMWIIISGISVMALVIISVMYVINIRSSVVTPDQSISDTAYVFANDQPQNSVSPIQQADLKLHLFFKNMDYTDDNGIIQQGTVDERADFQKDKGYTFCYDSEEFVKLEVDGTGKNISLVINEDGKIFFRKDNFEISGKRIFTTQDFVFLGMAEYKITIKQGNIVLFEGKIDSQGCM